jgi:hypothetical protein
MAAAVRLSPDNKACLREGRVMRALLQAGECFFSQARTVIGRWHRESVFHKLEHLHAMPASCHYASFPGYDIPLGVDG